jgi:hypothetical protein
MLFYRHKPYILRYYIFRTSIGDALIFENPHHRTLFCTTFVLL